MQTLLTCQWNKNWLADRKQAVAVEGEKSQCVSFDSGMQQGSVLGPGLFLYYINNLPAKLHSKVRLLPSGRVPRRHRSTARGSITLADWKHKWRIKFHPDKCTKLNVTNKRTPTPADFTLDGHTLASVSLAKYLGVTVTEDLRWDTHIKNICDKANHTIELICEALRTEERMQACV